MTRAKEMRDLPLAIDVDSSGNVTVSGATTFNSSVTASSFSGDGSALTGIGVGGATGIDLNDNVRVRFGTGNDLQIYHDGADSYITNSTGWLRHSNKVKFEDEVNFIGSSYNTEWLSVGHWLYRDNVQVRWGNSDDLTITHNGSSSLITSISSAPLYLKSNYLYISNTNNSSGTLESANGVLKLKYASATKLETTNTGVTVTGDINLGDNNKINFGAVEDLQIYHDGSDSYIKDTGSGNLLIQYSDLYFSKDAGSTHSVVFRSTGNVGIGTTGPSYKLHSETSSGTDYAAYFRNTSGSGNSTSLVARGGANNTSANFQVQDYNGNGDFTVNGIGQAMIGTTTPYNSRRRLSVHGVSTESAGYQDIVEFLEPNITGGTVSVNFGVANSLNNLAKVDFTYVGAGSTSNRVNLGFHSNDNKLMVYANGLVEVPSYLKSKKGTIQTVVNQPTIYTSANPVNTWAEVNSNFRIDITPRFASGTMILGTYSIPINPTGASNILMAIQPWYSTNGGTTKTMLNQGGPSGSRLSGSHAWFRSSNGYDANDMQNHVVHFGYTHSATTTLTWGFYFRSEGVNTTYFCQSNGNSSLWGWTAPLYMELREVEIA